MNRTVERMRHNVVLLGLALALVVAGGAPLLGGHEADAAKQGRDRKGSSAETRLNPRKTQLFENREQRIGIIDGAGPVTSAIEVSGFETPVTDVEVTLFGIFHGGYAGPDTNSSDDMDVLLVGPDGQSTLILSDVGGTTQTAVATLAFDDQAPESLPDSLALSPGTFRPTNFGSSDSIPGAPTPPSAASLAVFNGSDPNGTWRLWAYDDFTNSISTSGGGINGGWALRITTANGVPDAAPDDFKVKAGKTLSVPASGVLQNDSDPDGDALTAILANRPQKGTVALAADGSFTYKAKKKAKGQDSFTYLAQDPSGLNAAATVDIQIKGKKRKK